MCYCCCLLLVLDCVSPSSQTFNNFISSLVSCYKKPLTRVSARFYLDASTEPNQWGCRAAELQSRDSNTNCPSHGWSLVYLWLWLHDTFFFSFLFFFPGDRGNASSILGREPMGTGETITASNDAFNVHLGMLSESRHGEKCQPLHTHLVQFDSFLRLAGAKTPTCHSSSLTSPKATQNTKKYKYIRGLYQRFRSVNVG